ncbi:MAG: hypothetical protein LPD71_10425 [Shewanella sp.]|nr:hypothetical protein [Shewanella sp.]MCF1431372.1 hypothetical protein [Shewanella sp.]MCF1439136.1 hypothetical protein [Shewanella sp.]MCF1458267.1 hypothetical protein [Shewanella sp.]
MSRILLGLVLISGVAFADTGLWQYLSQAKRVEPIKLMQDVESQFPGVIAEFNTEQDKGELKYQIGIINPKDNSFTELVYRASDGCLLRRQTEKLKSEDKNDLAAAAKILKHNQTFSQLIMQAIQTHQAVVVYAQLERDLGINYLEVELLDADGMVKLAFDIDQQKPLPLLTWSSVWLHT